MKWALFEFSDMSCEVGETGWIVGENEANFTNDAWLTSQEVIVKWPKDFPKLVKKLQKGNMNIKDVATEPCSARIIKFSDDYKTIKDYLKIYVETGITKTPNRGRGHRISKRNQRYENEEDSEDDEQKAEPCSKKQKKMCTKNDDVLEKVKRKYQLNKTMSDEEDNPLSGSADDCAFNGFKQASVFMESDDEEEENTDVKKELAIFKKQNVEMQRELKSLRSIIKNMKAVPSLENVVQELHKCVWKLNSRPPTEMSTQRHSSSSSSTSTSRQSSPAPSCENRSSCSTHPSENGGDESNITENLVNIHPDLAVLKPQQDLLNTHGDAKTYTYALMEILWSREILATHSLTGQMSNAHKDKIPKPSLDPVKAKALCEHVSVKFKLTEKEVKVLIKQKLNNAEKCHKKKT